MWIVIKLKKKKEAELFKGSLKNILGSNAHFYFPKVLVEDYLKNKVIKKDYPILGNYIFLYHEKLQSKLILSKIQYTRGLEYVLTGFKNCQKEIQEFIDRCKNSENKSGYLTNSFYDLCAGNKIKINSGPFANFVSEIIKVNKNKIDLKIGNYKVTTTIDGSLLRTA